MQSGSSTEGASGNITLRTGKSLGNSGNVVVEAGDASGNIASGGSLLLKFHKL